MKAPRPVLPILIERYAERVRPASVVDLPLTGTRTVWANVSTLRIRHRRRGDPPHPTAVVAWFIFPKDQRPVTPFEERDTLLRYTHLPAAPAYATRMLVITLRADADPASVLRGSVLKPPTENARSLSREELKRFFRQLPTCKSRRTASAIRLLMMLFPRTIELCRARWDEIDPGAKEWKVPPEKIKSRRLQIVPLPKQAPGLLRELQEMYGNRGYILPILHGNRKRPHMSPATINRAIDYMVPDNLEPITGHDCRATASTNLHEMGWKD